MLPWVKFDDRVLTEVEKVMANVERIHADRIFFAKPCQEEIQFGKDGVHLRYDSVDIYAQYVSEVIDEMVGTKAGRLIKRKRKADQGLESEPSKIRLDQEEEMDENDEEGTKVIFRSGTADPMTTTRSADHSSGRDWDLAERVGKLEEKSKLDNLVMARQQEELDGIANEKTEDRFVVTGIYIPGFYRMKPEEKISRMKKETQSIVDHIMTPEKCDVVFVTQVNRTARSGPVTINAKMRDQETAKKFRTTFAKKMKDYNKDGNVPNELRGVNVLPVQRLATRVRIDILRGLADVVKEDSDERVSAYVISHIPRPILKIDIDMGQKSYSRTFAFTEAIEYVRLNHDITKLKKHQAYARAGSSFKGMMEQLFVVLK
jgi:hypothetical protein